MPRRLTPVSTNSAVAVAAKKVIGSYNLVLATFILVITGLVMVSVGVMTSSIILVCLIGLAASFVMWVLYLLACMIAEANAIAIAAAAQANQSS